METTEKIVESYVRYVKGWATISNIKCDGQREIDLLAVDLKTLDRYHIERGIHISGGFSKLTTKQFDPDKEMAFAFSNESRYFTDDTLRTIQLFCQAVAEDGTMA